MKAIYKYTILVALIALAIGVQFTNSPWWILTFTPMVLVIYYVECFVRRPALKQLGKTNKNIGGGYHSGGSLPGWTGDRDAKGSGGVNSSGVKVGGAGGSGLFGNDR